jgi:hypothetical protein
MERPNPTARQRRHAAGLAVFLLLIPVSTTSTARAADEFTAAPVSEDLVARGATWKFFRGRSEPSGGTLDWTKAGFADGGWETGAAGFGYDDDDDATVLADMEDGYTTVYIRKTFSVADPTSIGALELSINYDDGFIAFLNGGEIARSNAGPAGSYPAFDDVAGASHNAGTFEAFRVTGAGALLVPGTNVLAAVGLNARIDSSDFSLHPALHTADVIGEGCPGDFYVTGSRVLLAGQAPVPSTKEVLVGGAPAALDPASGAWSFQASLTGPVTTLAAEARDAAGAVIASKVLKAIRVRAAGGELEADATWKAADGPHCVVGQVSVPAGLRLTIEAGCTVFILPGAGFTIEGEIQARGTAARPILFTRLPCRENWGCFRFDGAAGENVFAFCEWSFATGSQGCLTLTDSNLDLDGCIIRDIDGEGVHANRCRTRIRNCLTERTNEALSLDNGDTVVEYCTIRDTIGKSDLIDCNGSSDPPARIAFNEICNTSDDGIDGDNGNMIIEGNVIHDCGDQAMSLVGTGSSTVRFNLCFRNGNGLSVKNSHVCVAEFNTFVANTVTGVRAIEKTSGLGGGIITLRNSIVWGNATQLVVESTGSIDAAYCDVEGSLVPGQGNLSLDPLFLDAAAADYRLGAGSPCRGAASDGGDLGALPFEAAPRAPSELTVSPSPDGGAALRWTDNSHVEESFEVERSAGGDFALIAALPVDARSYDDRDIPTAGTYRYRVRAVNSLGASVYSDIAEIVISTPAPAIAGIEPAEGPSEGGTPVVIRGSNFLGAVSATLRGVPLSGLQLVSAEEIRGVTPGGARGPAYLTVTAAGGEASLPAAFTYADIFLRGDATGDGELDLADALSILAYLFLDGAPPPCLDVADSNGDGEEDIGDAIFLLWHLYAGGAAPGPDVRCSS